MTQVKRICANSSKRRMGNKGGKAKTKTGTRRERGQLGTGVPRHNRVTGGGGGWDYGVGIGSNNMDSIEDCEYNTPLA